MIDGIAGSTYSTPTKPPRPGGEIGKDQFLQMLVAQLQNQDPLNPMSGDQMAAQLAQFSSLEQLTSINEALRGQNGNQQAMIQTLNGTAAIGALGKDVLAVGDQVEITSAGGSVTFAVEGNGGSATLRIYDAEGKEVGKRDLGVIDGGRKTVDVGSAADGLEPGQYTFGVEVVDSSGEQVATQPFTRGRVDGIRYGADGPVLTSGTLTIPFGAILEIGAIE